MESLLTKENLRVAIDYSRKKRRDSKNAIQVKPEQIEEIEKLLKNDSIKDTDLLNLLSNENYQLAAKQKTNLSYFNQYIDEFVGDTIEGKSSLDLLVEKLTQVVENKTKESSKILSNVNSEQSQEAVKEVQEYIDKRANGYSRRIIAIIGTGICIFIGIVSVIAATVAGVEEDDSSAVIVAGVFGAVVDAIGLALAICFFLYERKDDARKMQKDIVPGLDSAITAINCGTIINNGIITLGVGKAAEVVANAVCPVCNVKQNDICDICGHSFTDIPATEQQKKYGASDNECELKRVIGSPNEWLLVINGKQGEGDGNNKVEVYLDDVNLSIPNEGKITRICFSEKVRKIFLSKNNTRQLSNIKAISLFSNVKKIAFAESSEGYELGHDLFNGLDDIDYYGLKTIKKVGDHCFGGREGNQRFIEKTKDLSNLFENQNWQKFNYSKQTRAENIVKISLEE